MIRSGIKVKVFIKRFWMEDVMYYGVEGVGLSEIVLFEDFIFC